MKWKKVIASGLAAGVVILVIGMVSGSMMSDEYMKTPQLWKSMTGDWWYYMVVLDLIEGILYALAFTILYNGIPGKGWKKGMNFGLILWVVATIPGMLMTYLTMAVPDLVVAAWTFGGLISFLIAGPVIAIIHDKIK